MNFSFRHAYVCTRIGITVLTHLASAEDVFLCDTDVEVVQHFQHLVSCLPLADVHTHLCWNKVLHLWHR